MARLIWSGIQSLDGYIADADGDFDWSAPDEEVHAFVNERERGIGTYLYGRRLYEVMRVWQDIDETFPDVSPAMLDYARLWREADKVVYSTTLNTVLDSRGPDSSGASMSTPYVVSWPTPTPTWESAALNSPVSPCAPDIVDQYQLYVNPVIVGGGTSVPPTGRAHRPRAGRRASLLERRRLPGVPTAGMTTPERGPQDGQRFFFGSGSMAPVICTLSPTGGADIRRRGPEGL